MDSPQYTMSGLQALLSLSWADQHSLVGLARFVHSVKSVSKMWKGRELDVAGLTTPRFLLPVTLEIAAV
ncbi:hypothetical protein [Streptomyces sp. NPDC051109]|uniref:hypothetical protein n=1 Tax=Streptomyces sp. NPDC051109 TaxID=3365642 RepID=UPI0037BBAA93